MTFLTAELEKKGRAFHETRYHVGAEGQRACSEPQLGGRDCTALYPYNVVIEASVSRPRTPNLIPEKLGDPGMLPQAGDHRPSKTQQAGPCHS